MIFCRRKLSPSWRMQHLPSFPIESLRLKASVRNRWKTGPPPLRGTQQSVLWSHPAAIASPPFKILWGYGALPPSLNPCHMIPPWPFPFRIRRCPRMRKPKRAAPYPAPARSGNRAFPLSSLPPHCALRRNGASRPVFPGFRVPRRTFRICLLSRRSPPIRGFLHRISEKKV